MLRDLSEHLGKVRPAWLLLGVILLAAGLRLWRLDVLPPGLFFDEAYNGFDARQVLAGINRPLFFAANNGREPLFIYLQTLSVAVLGATPYALRIVSAMVGIAAVAIIYFTASTILTSLPASAEERRRAGWLALVAAIGAAVSYWHLSLSRLGFRANLLIPLSALALGFFWRAWTGQKQRDYVWTGVWLTLAMYTYIAARILPMVILVFVALEVIIGFRSLRNQRNEWQRIWKPRLRGLLIVAGVTVLGVLPLVYTLISDPALLSVRTGQVSIWAQLPGASLVEKTNELLTNVVAVLRAFYDQGDQNLRHNLPGRPVNDPLLAFLFTVGWLSALWHIRQPRSRFLLIWLIVMLAPTMLSTEAPHYLRGAAALPPLTIFYALGAETIVNLVRRAATLRPASLTRLQGETPLLLATIVVLLVFSGAKTSVDYFQRWATHPDLGKAFDVDRQMVAAETAGLLEDVAAANGVLMTADLYSLPHMGFLLGPIGVSLATETKSLHMLQGDQFDPKRSLILIRFEYGTPVRTWLQPFEMTAYQTNTSLHQLSWPTHQPGWPQVLRRSFPIDTPLQIRQIRYPLDVTFANGLRLVGYDVEPEVLQPGQDDARLTLFWQRISLDDARSVGLLRDFDVFVHLNVDGAVVQTNNGPLTYVPTTPLTPGEPLTEEEVRIVTLPRDVASGKAHFEVGLYDYRPGVAQGDLRRISIVDGSGQAIADRVDLGAVWIGVSPSQPDRDHARPLGVHFDNRIELSAVNVARDRDDTQRLWVDLIWKAVDRSTTDYTAFVHLLDRTGQQIISQHDAQPGGSDNPTSLWAPGEMVRSTFPLNLPEGMALSDATLRIGLYEPVSGKQLPITSPGASSADGASGTYVLISAEQPSK